MIVLMPPSRDEVRAAIAAFLSAANRPALIEAGQPEIPLIDGSYSLDDSPSGLCLHAWNESSSYSRRITGISKKSPGRLDVTIARLGKPDGVLTLFDAAHGRREAVRKRGRRETFREQFRRSLSRLYPGWTLAELSTAPDLEHSLSPSYPRALLTRGRQEAVAAVGAPDDAGDVDGALTSGLIWLDYLRRRDPKRSVSRLSLVLPEHRAATTALRLRWLDWSAAEYELFVRSEEGDEAAVDPRDWGNLNTRLEVASPHRANLASQPEARLEAQVRSDIRALDAALVPGMVYAQAPAVAAVDRGVMDLLAIDLAGRLCVIELKAFADLHLPLQALDYWMRVKWHLDHGDFERHAYFPGQPISRAVPRIYLVAPALEFHPTTDTILRFFAPAVPVTKLGLASNDERDLKVILRQEHTMVRDGTNSATARGGR